MIDPVELVPYTATKDRRGEMAIFGTALNPVSWMVGITVSELPLSE